MHAEPHRGLKMSFVVRNGSNLALIFAMTMLMQCQNIMVLVKTLKSQSFA